jgi:2-polyprenyl-3-methyl-5-hydroxy-6-metoxy-1,4-benzoquinol methylase
VSADRQPLPSDLAPDPASATDRFADYYAQPKAPWDIGRPQTPFVGAADRIGPRVLDIGCGTGDLAIWLAERGHAVTGIDFIDPPLAVARRKAAERGVAVNFLRMDALAVGELPERFAAVTDCGLFHTFDDAGRAAYVRGLARLLESGSRVFLLCMSTAEPGRQGPRRVSEPELREAFSAGWAIETLEPARFEVVPGIPGAEFSPGGAHAWFAVVRRV